MQDVAPPAQGDVELVPGSIPPVHDGEEDREGASCDVRRIGCSADAL
jgi:hypothetical protein